MRVVRGGASQGGAVPLYPLRPMPFEQATAWGPALTGDARPSRPEAPGQVFITPDALRAVAWHTSLRREGGSVGFFAGRRHLDPDTREPWVLVDAVIPVDRPIARELPGRLIDETIDQAGDAAREALRYLVGWYHSHHARQPVLTAAAMETHERYFADELHAIVVVVTVGHAEPQGAVFRPGVERGPVPFYELLEDDADLVKHPRPTALQWRNYFTVEVVKREVTGRRSHSLWDPIVPPAALGVARQDTTANAPGAEPPADLDSLGDREPTTQAPGTLHLVTRDEVVVGDAEREPPWWTRRRALLIGAIAVTAAAVLAVVATRPSGGVPPTGPAIDVVQPRVTTLDRAAVAVTSAVRAYRDLSLLFDRRQVDCQPLGSALVTLEQRWMDYTVAKSEFGQPLGAAAIERERALDVGVRGAEQHFLASTCPRP